MAFGKLINLFALSSLAILVCNLGVSPVNALSNDHHGMLKVKRAHGHDGIAKRKRSTSQRCKARTSTDVPTSTSSSSSTPAWTPTSTSAPAKSSSSKAASKTSSHASASTEVANSNGSGKIGLAWANGNTDSLKNFVNNNVNYIYTWSEQCPSEAASLGLTCMPMLWGDASDKLSAFKSTVTAGYAHIALGFNEVNEAGQANMDVGTAVSIWKQYLEPLVDEGYTLLAPVTSSNPDGLTWVQQFFQQCTGCHISGIPLHYYGTSASEMQTYIELWSSTFNLPIWVTEFACENYDTANENNGQQCSESQVWSFYTDIINYMEGNSNVVAYFPFGFMTDMQGVNTLDQLMNGDGTPSALGSAIINRTL
ncbi:hypothetical protein M0805_000097 [Coniferiporia weirii]|nr:hypothetical protein M0805_000097 [Coniferiporia weirii]